MRKRIAVLLDMFDAKYQSELVQQLRLAALQRLTELVVYPGGWLASDARGGARRRAVFDLVSADSVDGVIVLSSCLSGEVGATGLQSFCERFAGLPLCTIGEPVGNLPSAVVDNEHGVRALLKHLIVDHGYRRIGLIRGPVGNAEADTRYRTSCRELAAHAIDFDPSLVRVGDFLSESGRVAMDSLLDAAADTLDAVVAANDYMALGALEALARRAGRLRRTIAVTGFDDIDDANFSAPPLTTVEQPFADLGASAVRCIHSQLQHEQVPAQVVLHTSLVIRRSCGCTPDGDAEPAALMLRGSIGNFEVKFMLQREALMAELSRASRGSFRGLGNWEVTLIAALVDDLRGMPGDVFEAATDRVLRNLDGAKAEVWRFQDVVTALRLRTLRILGEHAPERARAEDLFQLAFRMTTQAVMRRQAGSRLALERTWRVLNDLGTGMAQCSDQATFTAVLDRELPRLGVRQAFLSSYLDPISDGQPRRAQLLYGLDKSIRIAAADHEPFLARALLPTRLASAVPSLSWVVLPLFFRELDQGFALVELHANEGATYEALRVHLSVGLAGIS
jgi:sigma-B regulation protein RsbU (phosphoserine phosphatase)